MVVLPFTYSPACLSCLSATVPANARVGVVRLISLRGRCFNCLRFKLEAHVVLKTLRTQKGFDIVIDIVIASLSSALPFGAVGKGARLGVGCVAAPQIANSAAGSWIAGDEMAWEPSFDCLVSVENDSFVAAHFGACR